MEKNINKYRYQCCSENPAHAMHHKKQPEVICYIAGHSGGHIIPCLTLAAEEKELFGHTILFITSAKSLDERIIKESGIVDKHYMFTITQKRRWYLLPFLALTMLWSFIKAVSIFIRHRPSRIISTGSIVAIPGCLAAWILRIDIELFEVNAQPGKTIIFLSRFATKIDVCFSQPKHFFTKVPCEIRPYPIRFTEFTGHQLIPHLAHFTPDRSTIFIQGGSQGSIGINHLIRMAIEMQPTIASHLQIIHQTGGAVEPWYEFYAHHKVPCYVFNYEHNVAPYYQAAEIIICRSGAGSLFEVLYFQKPCITIPLITTTSSHQKENAHAMASAYPELFQVIEPGNDLYARFQKAIIPILRPLKDITVHENNRY